MDNPMKGEVTFEAAGKTHTLVFSTNASCALEAHLDRGIADVLDEIGTWAQKTDAKGIPIPETMEQMKARAKLVRVSLVRALFWAGLSDHHPELTIEDAGKLMTEIGGMNATVQLLTSGLTASQPDAEETSIARPSNRAERRRLRK